MARRRLKLIFGILSLEVHQFLLETVGIIPGRISEKGADLLKVVIFFLVHDILDAQEA